MTEPGTIRLAGVLATVEKKFTKKDGRPFGVMVLEDDSGTLEMSAWEDSFTKHELILKPGNVISCNVKVVPRDGAIRATANDFKALTPKPSKKALRLRMDRARLIVDDLHSISAAIKKHPGKRTLILEIGTLSGKIVPLQLGEEFTVGDEMALRAELAPCLGIWRMALLLLGQRRKTTPFLARLARHPDFQTLDCRIAIPKPSIPLCQAFSE